MDAYQSYEILKLKRVKVTRDSDVVIHEFATSELVFRTLKKGILATYHHLASDRGPKNQDGVQEHRQRALVLQGGGALGAYEAGVYRVLYDWISNHLTKYDRANENVFDSIAGTSIGAINAAIIVSYVKEKIKARGKEQSQRLENWEGSAEKLEEFWIDGISAKNEFMEWWTWWLINLWTIPRVFLPVQLRASQEAARRYYSTRVSLLFGELNVYAPIFPPLSDYKFFNFLMPEARWHRYSNQPLRMSIKDYAVLPIKTSPGEPRLLVVSVDVQSADAVTFDSYADESKYGKRGDTKNDDEHTIKYKDGIMVEHLIASASVPLHYNYEPIPIKYDYPREPSNSETNSYYYNTDYDYKHFRYFWDGALLSNTPLIQLMRHHRDFYKSRANSLPFDAIWEEENGAGSSRAPDLDIYLVNVWQKKEKDNNLPSLYDYDLTKDRKNDITHHDKTEHDEEDAKSVSNYITMVKETRNLARKYISIENREKFDRELEEFLKRETKTKSKTSKDKPKTYEDLLKGRFNIGKVIRVERQDDPHTISDKWFDFSHETVIRMIGQGKVDTLRKVIDDLRSNIHRIIDEDSSSERMHTLNAHLKKANDELDYADLKLANINMSPSDSNEISLLYDKAMYEMVLFMSEVQRMEQQEELTVEQADLLRPLTLGS